jgi:hypothetical protein
MLALLRASLSLIAHLPRKQIPIQILPGHSWAITP